MILPVCITFKRMNLTEQGVTTPCSGRVDEGSF